MTKTPHIFTGAGNNFVVFDGREGGMDEYRQPERIQALCKEYRTDGLMILTEAPGQDFGMEFYNPDGSGGMMCGNGGRCIVAFADYLGLKPASSDGTWHFLAPDGIHEAIILGRPEISPRASLGRNDSSALGRNDRCVISSEVEKSQWTVRLKMIDVMGVSKVKDGYFLNTGTRHYVQFVEDVDSIDMEREARPIRWDAEFQPEGTNVNFVQVTPEGLKVRTFEKGVEGETLACGTGITASAIAAYCDGIPDHVGDDKGVSGTDARHARPRPGISYRLQCRRGDWLTVEFTREGPGFKDIYLTGPAELIEK